MRVEHQRLAAALLLAAVGLVALFVSGLLDWITSILFLILELLAGSLHTLTRHRRRTRHRHAPFRGGHPTIAATAARDRHRRFPRRKVFPRRRRDSAETDDGSQAAAPAAPSARVLVPVTSERPGLIAFALDECQNRNAELLVLILRPLAVVPMGPLSLPGLTEDAQAGALLEVIEAEARDAGVPFRSLYAVTRDMPGTILEVARTHKADVVVMEATRRNLLWRALLGDEIRAVLMHLPEHVNLLIHSP
jgi:nucleotide-binding universal stress UspA family protein